MAEPLDYEPVGPDPEPRVLTRAERIEQVMHKQAGGIHGGCFSAALRGAERAVEEEVALERQRIAQELRRRNTKGHGEDCLCLVCAAFEAAARIVEGDDRG